MYNKSSVVNSSTIVIAGVLLVAANLRAPITGVAPVLGYLHQAFSITTAQEGELTTLPLLIFALGSPFCVHLSRALGLERSLFVALVLISVGVLFRSFAGLTGLYIGTGVIGIGVAIANVLLPGLVKRDFPERVAAMTSAYALTSGLFAAVISASVVPIANSLNSGWEFALAAVLPISIGASLVWSTQLGQRHHATPTRVDLLHVTNVWTSRLAWQISLFFGLNSLVYYVTVTWLPTILTDASYSPAEAGSVHATMQLATAVPGLVIGRAMKRFNDQKLLAFTSAILTGVALAGILILPAYAFVWAALFGFGTGSTFILGLAFLSMRVHNSHQAANLSGMAQGVGYLVAAIAPPLVGKMHDVTMGWTTPIAVCVACCGIMALCGLRAGRNIFVS